MFKRINKCKRLVCLLSVFVVSCVMMGCAELSYDKDKEQLMVDYMVKAVLNHDRDYNSALIYMEVETEPTTTWNYEHDTPEKPNEEETTNNGDGSGEQETTSPPIIVETDINKILNFSGLSVTYTDYFVTDSYPDESSFASMKAMEGSNLVVLKFNVTNTTEEELSLNMLEKNIKFKGIFNSKVKANSQITLLPDAFNTFVGTFAPFETKEVVLIYIVSEKSLDTISTIKLEVKNDDKADTIILKK